MATLLTNLKPSPTNHLNTWRRRGLMDDRVVFLLTTTLLMIGSQLNQGSCWSWFLRTPSLLAPHGPSWGLYRVAHKRNRLKRH